MQEDGTDTQILHKETFKLGKGRLKSFDFKESTEIETNQKKYEDLIDTAAEKISSFVEKAKQGNLSQ